MPATSLSLLLADDDLDDCAFFKEALAELPVNASLTTVNDGVQLMQLLSEKEHELPDALYLDLNMPRKNGLDCLSEIKQNIKLKKLPVIIFSTSLDPAIVNQLHENGANYYIRKPAEFSNLKKIILRSLHLISISNQQALKENFIIKND